MLPFPKMHDGQSSNCGSYLRELVDVQCCNISIQFENKKTLEEVAKKGLTFTRGLGDKLRDINYRHDCSDQLNPTHISCPRGIEMGRNIYKYNKL